MTLSVVMCNYNYAHYIRHAIDGIVNQSRLPDELIIIDDGSTDNSVEIIQSYTRRYSWIHLYRHPTNLGVYRAGQYGLQLAKGEFIYFASSDDRVLPSFFETALQVFQKYPKAAMCCSNPACFEKDEECIQPPLDSKEAVKASTFIPAERVFFERGKGLVIAGHTSIYRKDKIIEAGGIQPSLGHLCDYFFSLVIAFRYGVIFTSMDLALRRVHPRALSVRCSQDPQPYAAYLGTVALSAFADVRKRLLAFRTLNENRRQFIVALFASKRHFKSLACLLLYEFFSQFALLKKLKQRLNRSMRYYKT